LRPRNPNVDGTFFRIWAGGRPDSEICRFPPAKAIAPSYVDRRLGQANLAPICPGVALDVVHVVLSMLFQALLTKACQGFIPERMEGDVESITKLLAVGLVTGLLLAGCSALEWKEDTVAMGHAFSMYYAHSWDPVCGDKDPFTTCHLNDVPPIPTGPDVHVVHWSGAQM
jgi:hypothetical protein